MKHPSGDADRRTPGDKVTDAWEAVDMDTQDFALAAVKAIDDIGS